MFKTKADLLVEFLEAKKEVSVDELTSLFDASSDVILAHAQYLEDAGILSIKYTPKPVLTFIQSPEIGLEFRNERELINKIKVLLEVNNLKEINRLLYELYSHSKRTKDETLSLMYTKAHDFYMDYLKKHKILQTSTQGSKTQQLIKEIADYKISLHN